MARRKKMNRHHQCQCRVCHVVFEAVRDDARYCSPKCRQRISRFVRAAAKPKARPVLNANGKVECSECGIRRDGRVKKCPTCHSPKCRKVK